MGLIFWIIVVAFVGMLIVAGLHFYRALPDQRIESAKALVYGELNPQLICPHCNVKGQVRTKPDVEKKGISTINKVTGGMGSYGMALPGNKLFTRATCGNCWHTWAV